MKGLKRIYRPLIYFFVLVLKFIVQHLPRPLALSFGRMSGLVCSVLLKKERKRAVEHLLFVYQDAEKAQKIAREVFKNLGMNLFEWLQMGRLNQKKIGKIVKVTGIENINSALSKGKGVIIITAHLGNWEYLAAYFGLNGYKGAVIARSVYYQKYNRLLESIRLPVGVETVWREGSAKDILRVLKRNQLLGILPDQDTKKVDGIFVDFFGRPAYTPTGPVTLALATGAVIIPSFLIRVRNKFHLHIEKPLNLTIAGGKEETIKLNTEKWSAVVEKYIKRYPGQWVWMHRRWRTNEKKES